MIITEVLSKPYGKTIRFGLVIYYKIGLVIMYYHLTPLREFGKNMVMERAWTGICVKCLKQFRSPPPTRDDMEFHCGECDECWNRTVESHTSKLIGKVLTEKELRD